LLQSEIPPEALPEGYITKHQRMRAKLIGFLQSPEAAFSYYAPQDVSVPARYARAVAYHRQQKRDKAIAEIDSLLKESPEDPFFLELKGQILAESGEHQAALPYYEKASKLLPQSALLRTEYAATLLTQNPAPYQQAVEILKIASVQDNSNPMTWHLLAQAYTGLGQKGQAALAAAEKEMLNNNPLEALRQANLALEAIPSSHPSRLRAEDIKTEATRLYQKKAKKK
jgi:predicted Zn-dependent protease